MKQIENHVSVNELAEEAIAKGGVSFGCEVWHNPDWSCCGESTLTFREENKEICSRIYYFNTETFTKVLYRATMLGVNFKGAVAETIYNLYAKNYIKDPVRLKGHDSAIQAEITRASEQIFTPKINSVPHKREIFAWERDEIKKDLGTYIDYMHKEWLTNSKS